MRRTVPVLRNRQEIAIPVVIEGDHSRESVCNSCNVTLGIVADRNIIAVAIFYLRAVILIVLLGVSQLRAVR